MPKAMVWTYRQLAGFSDMVLTMPSSELVAGASPSLGEGEKSVRRRKAKPWELLYGGYEGLLVRTVLMRSDKYATVGDLPVVSSAGQAHKLLEHIGYYDQEHVVVLGLDGANHCTAIFEAGKGGTHSAAVEAKHILKVPVLTASSAIIIAHNHPGGDPTPSRQDRELTDRVKQACECVGVALVDHLIESHGKYLSFLDAGLI